MVTVGGEGGLTLGLGAGAGDGVVGVGDMTVGPLEPGCGL